MSSIINAFIIISLILTFAYFVGLLTFIADHEENKCEMTYMFEYPQFVRISNKIDSNFPKYGLYAYSEGRWTERTRNMYFDGIPVVFVPGNAGSHRQVRSLASIALRKAVNSRTPYHFDYFTIDLNSELSGLNGAVLSEQKTYVNHSIYRVLDLYNKSRNPAKSLILVGHSMGGIIARSIISDLPPDSGLIPIIITLATPHQRPPLILDSYIYDFYNKINFNQSQRQKSNLISVSGGYSDFLVPSFLTQLANDKNSLHVVTTHIPRSWLAADHLCILWCKQTILTINRALFDAVDPKTKQISSDPDFVKMVFHHHLVLHSGTNIHMRDSKTHIKNDGEWIEKIARQYSIQMMEGVKQPHFYMIRLLDNPQHESLTVIGLNVKTVDWAFVCGAHTPKHNGRVCEEFTHLTQITEIAPTAKYKRRILRVNLHKLLKQNPDFTHVVLRVLPTDEPVVFHVDVYNSRSRTLVINLPHLLSFKRHILIEETPENGVHFKITLPQLESVIQSYQLYVEPVSCKNEFKHATASLIVPWANQNQHKHFVDGDYAPMHLRLYAPKPQWASNKSPHVILTLDPTCRYRVSVKSSIFGTLSQLARFYSPLMVANMAAVILMALNAQMTNVAKQQYCSLFFVAVKDGAKPYYILTVVKLLSRFLSLKVMTNFMAPDWLILSQEGTDFFLLPLLLYMISVGIVWILSIGLCVSLVVFETTVHKLALKFLARTVSFTVSWSDYVMSALHKLPFVVAATLIFLTVSTSGGLALSVGMVFYFLRLTQLSQDYIEELVWHYVKKIGRRFKKQRDEDSSPDENKTLSAHNSMFFHATLFLLWSLVTVINIPSVLTWAHNFKFSASLKPDPAFFPALILSACALPLWQLDLPRVQKRFYKETGQIIAVLAVLSLIYAPVSVFRLNYTLSSVFIVVVLHQLFAGNRIDIGEPHDDDVDIKYEGVKAKLE